MSREFIFSTVAAVALHAGAFFGLRLGTSAVALPLGDQANIEVSLVAEVPSEPIAAPTEPPSPPEPEPLPPPPEEEMQEPSPDIAPPTPAPVPKPPRQTSKSSTAVARPMTRQGPVASTGARSVGAATMARPRYRSNPRPAYPPAARQSRQEGTTILQVEVTAGGHASEIAIQQSSGFPILDQAAVSAVRRWTFEPGRIGALPVSSRVQIPVRFRLSD